MIMAAALAAPLGAVQLSDLNPAMTRNQADDELTKDYAYRIVSDLTVRRIWNLDANRKLSVDFDPKKDKLLYVLVEYKKPVAVKDGMEDAAAMTHAEKVKWKKLDVKKAVKYAVENARVSKVGDAYLFLECNSSGKCVRVAMYTDAPKENRRHLNALVMGSSGATALGNNARADAGRELKADEAARQARANKTDVAGGTPQEAEEEDFVVSSAPKTSPTASAAAAPTDEAAFENPGEVGVPQPPPNVASKKLQTALDKAGLGEVTPTQWGIGAVALVLLLTIIGMVRRSNEAKRLRAKARAMSKSDPGATLRARSGLGKPRVRR